MRGCCWSTLSHMLYLLPKKFVCICIYIYIYMQHKHLCYTHTTRYYKDCARRSRLQAVCVQTELGPEKRSLLRHLLTSGALEAGFGQGSASVFHGFPMFFSLCQGGTVYLRHVCSLSLDRGAEHRHAATITLDMTLLVYNSPHALHC